MTSGPLKFVLDPKGDELAAALSCEAEVFLQRYGNTVEEFAVEYGPYEQQTLLTTLLEADGQAAGVMRIITPGPAGLKTFNDVSRPPWEIDGLASAREAGVDPDRTWDIATVAVRRGSGRGGLCAMALYNGLINATYANDIDIVVMILDARVRELFDLLGMHAQELPGATPGEYLGSPNSVPLWANVRESLEGQRVNNPEAYQRVTEGIGLDGITMPTDWTWHR